MWRSFRYRLYPLQRQSSVLHLHRFELAYLWNFALGQRIDAWVQVHRSISYSYQQRDLTRWRNRDSDGVGRVSVHVAQNCLQSPEPRLSRVLPAGEGRPTAGVPSLQAGGRFVHLHPRGPPGGALRMGPAGEGPEGGRDPSPSPPTPSNRCHRKDLCDAPIRGRAWYATFSLKLSARPASTPPNPALRPPSASTSASPTSQPYRRARWSTPRDSLKRASSASESSAASLGSVGDRIGITGSGSGWQGRTPGCATATSMVRPPALPRPRRAVRPGCSRGWGTPPASPLRGTRSQRGFRMPVACFER